MLLLKSSSLPEDYGWILELKLDGYRALAFKNAGELQPRLRNDNDMAARYSRKSWFASAHLRHGAGRPT
jgi:ATP-dependent DNA ligase